MCRSIKKLRNAEPATTPDDVEAAALQFVRKVSGYRVPAKKNEDAFSVQIMDTRERIQGYLKEDMREVRDGTRSAMPVYSADKLSENDLNDLLAYLNTLRGTPAAAEETSR